MKISYLKKTTNKKYELIKVSSCEIFVWGVKNNKYQSIAEQRGKFNTHDKIIFV